MAGRAVSARRLGAAMLATSLVIDQPGQGTLFPSAGGNSASLAVQAVYWRCAAVFFASARITNPQLRLGFFSNVTPPVVDGIDLGELFARLDVEQHCVPLTHRLARDRAGSWGNVLYFADVLDAFCQTEPAENADTAFVLADCDVLVAHAIDPLLAQLAGCDFLGHRIDTAIDDDINGMTPRRMARAVAELGQAAPGDAVIHYGGELFATSPAAWRRHRALFADLLERQRTETGIAGEALTEEHVWSIAFACLGPAAGTAHGVIKRIWTALNFNTASPGDEALPLWHLPAEKRYGLKDMFGWLAQRDFAPQLDPEQLRRAAQRLCGVPRKPLAKLWRDGVRQLAARVRRTL